MNVADIRTLYAFNRWANHRILDAASSLDDDAFSHDLGTSFGSIQATLVHVFWAEWTWLQRWRGTSPKELFDPLDYPTAVVLRVKWSEVEREQRNVVEALTDDRLGERIGYENIRGERWEYTLGHLMQHVVNHSTYHRGQVVTLLRQLGRTAPSTDFLLWFDEGEPA